MTIGALVSIHSVSVREKFGRYPPVERLWHSKDKTKAGPKRGVIREEPANPLPGKERDVVEPLPDLEAMSDVEKMMTPMNRADYRKRIFPHLPRKMRKTHNYAHQLHDRVNRGWVVDGEEE